jgi:hypothetical protein
MRILQPFIDHSPESEEVESIEEPCVGVEGESLEPVSSSQMVVQYKLPPPNLSALRH